MRMVFTMAEGGAAFALLLSQLIGEYIAYKTITFQQLAVGDA